MPHAPSEGRVPWVDTAKGVCIVLVVMMHATLGVEEAFGREGFMHWAVAYAQPFRMPDFFLVSGLFLARVVDRDWRAYADKRVVHFLYFYLLWLLIQSAVKYPAVSGGSAAGFVEHLAFAFVEPFGTLWFVYALALFSGVTKLLRGVPPLVLLGGAALLEIAPIHTGWTLLDEFGNRYVYFLAGYLLAPHIFRLAQASVANRGPALAGLFAWAVLNGVLAFTPSGVAGFPTLASLPVVSLLAGALGAVAIVVTAALLAERAAAAPFAYAGRHSIAIYLAFFLPMAATRAVLLKLGLLDPGVAAAIVTAAAVLVPLVLERIVRGTPADFLFVRPALFSLRPRPRLQPAE